MKYETVDVHIAADVHEAKKAGRSIIKVTVSQSPLHENVIGSFWIPMATYDEARDIFVKAIEARAKHDFKIIIGHYSSCGW